MAFDAFMQIDGIEGDSTDAEHSGWIEVQSFHHSISQPVGGSRSSGGAATAGRVEHQDFTVTKELDKATVLLYLQCCKGTHIPSVQIELCRAGDNPKPFMRYKLSHVLISNISPSGVPGSKMPSENVSFNYGKIEWEYLQTDPRSADDSGSTPAYWDTVQNKGG